MARSSNGTPSGASHRSAMMAATTTAATTRNTRAHTWSHTSVAHRRRTPCKCCCNSDRVSLPTHLPSTFYLLPSTFYFYLLPYLYALPSYLLAPTNASAIKTPSIRMSPYCQYCCFASVSCPARDTDAFVSAEVLVTSRANSTADPVDGAFAGIHIHCQRSSADLRDPRLGGNTGGTSATRTAAVAGARAPRYRASS